MTVKEKRQIEKAIFKAIDYLVKVQDLGGGTDAIQRALDLLNSEVNKYITNDI